MGQTNIATKQIAKYTSNTFSNDNSVFGKNFLEESIREIRERENREESSDFIPDEDSVLIKSNIITTTKKEGQNSLKTMTESTPIAKWEGIVISVDRENNTFKGELRDILNGDDGLIVADFDFDDIEESKHNLIKDNSIFYWNIYDERGYQGKKRGTNYIYFREILPIWKNYDFNNISSEITRMHKAIFDDNCTT